VQDVTGAIGEDALGVGLVKVKVDDLVGDGVGVGLAKVKVDDLVGDGVGVGFGNKGQSTFIEPERKLLLQ